MKDSSNLYAVLLLISAILSAFAGGVTLRRRSSPGAQALFLFLLGSSIWSFTYAIHWIAAAPSIKQIWLNMTYFGVVITPTAMLVFILQFVQRDRWLSGWKVALFVIEPALTILILWTDPLHGLFYGNALTSADTRIFNGGPWFWINAIYSYILIAAGLLLLLNALVRPGQIYRRQALLVLLGSLAPVVSNFITFAGLNPFPGLDLTPMAFTITGAILTFSLFRYGLLDLIPIGRDVLMEKMDEGMLLLDDNNRIIDMNPAAHWLLQLSPKVSIGNSIEQALAHSPELVNLIKEHAENKSELSIGEEAPLYLQIQITRVQEQPGRPAGTLLIVHNISDQKKTEADLLRVNHHLQTQIRKIEELQTELRDQTFRDPLTGLFNRRYLEETMPRELAKSSRAGKPLSVIMIDIDHFKRLNDIYGHLAGDLTLQRLSHILLNSTRSGDIVSRFGGDEFVVVFTDTPAIVAVARAQEWRSIFSGSDIIYDSQPFRVTFSAGVVTNLGNRLTSEELIRKADDALYQVKSSGRDGVQLSE